MSQCHLTSMSAATLQTIFSNLSMIWNLVGFIKNGKVPAADKISYFPNRVCYNLLK